MADNYSVAELSRMLALRMDDLALTLYPQGQRVAHEWCVGDINGNPGNSLKIVITGSKAGVWKDWADDGQKAGDPIDLIQARLRLTTGDAVAWAKDWLGLADGRERPTPKRELASDDQEKRAEKARRLWESAVAAEGTLVETYLKSRGINLTPPKSLRFCSNLKHWIKEGKSWSCDFQGPAMLAAVTQPDGTITAVQRTWLKADGSGKALITPNKMTYGPMGTGIVRLAPSAETYVVAEGVETGLSWATARPSYGVCATLGTSQMARMACPSKEKVKTIILALDGDQPSLKAGKTAARRFIKEGFTVKIAQAPKGRDWNDILKEQAAKAG